MASKDQDHIILPVASEEWHQWGVQIAQIIAKAWVDDAFKARFVAAPVEVLAEHGLIVPSDVTVKVNENSTAWSLSGPGIVRADTYEIPLPPKPSGDDLLRAWAEGDAGHAPVVSEGGRVAFGGRVATKPRVSTGPRVASKPRVSSAGRVASAGRVSADDDES